MLKSWQGLGLVWLLGMVTVFAAGHARATVSEYSSFVVPYQRAQSESVCLDEQLMEAEFGIPLASMLSGVFAPTRTLHQAAGRPNTYRNINLLAPGAARINWQMNFDRYSNGIYEYSFMLDLAAFRDLYGDSRAGRQQTLQIARLAVIATLKTAELTHGAGQFRVWIQFRNLPAQQDLPGLPVHAGAADWPGWPYVASSELYQGYLRETIHRDC